MKTTTRKKIRKMSAKKKSALLLCLLSIFFLNLSYVNSAQALPQDYEVVSGQADFKMEDSVLTINASDKTIINYKSFDIAQNEKVLVNLPDISSQILNRVNSSSPTQIFGALSCNGIFILVNESGIYVAPGATINASGLVLSTRDINNQNFTDGNLIFQRLSKDGMDRLLLNEGKINITNGGFGVLIAGAIENRGIITAKGGTIVLAGGNYVTLQMTGNRFISIAIEESVAKTVYDYQGRPITDQIKNTGTLDAEGGTIILFASSINDIFTRAINLEGTVIANKVENRGGVIKIVTKGDVSISGSVEAGEIVMVNIGTRVVPDFDAAALEDITIGLRIPEKTSALEVRLIPDEVTVELGARVKATEMIRIEAVETINVASTIEAPTVTLVSGGDVTTRDSAIISATNLNITAQRFGTSVTPVKIDAQNIYIKRPNGDIDIRESVGIGESIWIRGPPDKETLNFIYNRNASQLTLEGSHVIISGDQPIYLYGNITFSNLTCTIPNKYIYFEAGKTYTILGELKLQGAYGQHVRLLSSETGTQWYIDPQGAHEVSYVNVYDSYNLDPRLIVGYGIHHDVNSYNWDADLTAVATGDWNVAATWGGFVPGPADSVTIGGGFTVTVTALAFCTWVRIQNTGTLKINDGIILIMTGNWNLDVGGKLDAGKSTVVFNGVNQKIDPGGIGVNERFYDVRIAGGANCASLTKGIGLHDFTINPGSDFDANGQNISISGDWMNNGIYTPNGNTVILDPAAQAVTNIGGDNTFRNLVCDMTGSAAPRTILFGGGDTQTVTGTLVLKGASPLNMLVLRSSTVGNQWRINPSGSNISNVDVQDSDNLSLKYLVPYPPTSENNGNNDWWFTPFAPKPPSSEATASDLPGEERDTTPYGQPPPGPGGVFLPVSILMYEDNVVSEGEVKVVRKDGENEKVGSGEKIAKKPVVPRVGAAVVRPEGVGTDSSREKIAALPEALASMKAREEDDARDGSSSEEVVPQPLVPVEVEASKDSGDGNSEEVAYPIFSKGMYKEMYKEIFSKTGATGVIKVKTIVIVMEGLVDFSAYNEKGLIAEGAKMLQAGQKATQIGDV